MKSSTSSRLESSRHSHPLLLTLVICLIMLTAGCGRVQRMGDLIPGFSEPTASPTPTSTPTPQPTATPQPGDSAAPTTQEVATPQVTIPANFTPIMDEVRGYSLALPSGWTELDLRGQQITRMAGLAGQGEALTQLQEFLETAEGRSIGMVAVTDLSAAIFGGLPTIANVSVIASPGAMPENVSDALRELIERNASTLGSVTIEELTPTTVNNLPAVTGIARADLSGVGMDAQLFVKVVGLIANDQIYVLTMATPDGNRAEKEPIFDQIIGTFRPE